MSKCPNTKTDEYCCDDFALSSCNCTSGQNVLRFSGQPSALTTIGVTAIFTSNPTTSSTVVTSSFTPSTAFQISTSTPNSSTSPTASTLISSSTNSAAIGAGVGVPLGVIAIAGLAFFFFKSRRRSNQINHSYVMPSAIATHELYDPHISMNHISPKHASTRQELPQGETLHELDSSANRTHNIELPVG